MNERNPFAFWGDLAWVIFMAVSLSLQWTQVKIAREHEVKISTLEKLINAPDLKMPEESAPTPTPTATK